MNNIYRITGVMCFSIVAILFAMVLAHGHYLSFENYFTPWTHDDFFALEGFDGFRLVSRPVSTNLIHLMGAAGVYFYYSIFTLIWFVSFIATQLYILKIFKLKVGGVFFISFVFFGALLWYLHPASPMTLQYLGLMTNALSYLFGVLAALSMLYCNKLKLFSMRYNFLFFLIALLVLLSAFSKEDMALFLVLAALYASFSRYFLSRNISEGVLQCLFCVGIVVLSYLLCMVSSFYLKSPIIGNSGAYRITDSLFLNVMKHAAFYISGFKLVLFVLMSFSVALFIFIKPVSKALFLPYKIAYIICLFFALMAPYLILPRQFAYYAVTFAPILIFSLMPFFYIALNLSFLKGIGTYGAFLCATIPIIIIAIIFQFSGSLQRKSVLSFVNEVRSDSLKQFQGIDYALSRGLSHCEAITVLGASNHHGPFLNKSEKYLNHRYHLGSTWDIVVVPETILYDFSKKIPNQERWRYIRSDEVNHENETCVLAYDPKTLGVTFFAQEIL